MRWAEGPISTRCGRSRLTTRWAVQTFKPRPSAWIVLAIICLPIAALGVADLILNPTQWAYAVALIVGATLVVGYNFTARLVIDRKFVTLKRRSAFAHFGG
jgi:hypothetical protein